MDYKKFLKLDEMKLNSRGNPQKLAEYNVLKHEFEKFVESHREHPTLPFLDKPDEAHVNKLKEFVEEYPGDEAAKAVYALQKSIFDKQEAEKTAPIDRRLVKGDLIAKLQAGELTQVDVKAAQRMARENGSIENMALFSQIKRAVEAAEQAPEVE